jgi:phosphatidate cytidylyltransferase
MLRARVLTALCLLTAFLSALFFLPAQGWLILSVLVAGLAAWEWGGLMGWSAGLRGAYPLALVAVAAALGVATGLHLEAVARHPALLAIYLAGAAFWLLCVPPWLSRKWRLRGLAAGLASGGLVLVPAALALAHARQVSPVFLLACMAAVWLADIGAYFVGRALGRHKLAPTISPGKSWEGAVGGALAVVLYGLTLALAQGMVAVDGFRLAGMAVALLAYAAVSVEGDLFESLLKRQAGLKDSGHILPGHGGVLDRIDSLTSTLPLVGLAVLYHYAP